jgi:hypothetical protein
VGTYQYIYNTTGGTNYTANASIGTFELVVDKKIPFGNLTNTDTWTEPYLEEITIGLEEGNSGDGDVTYIIYRDGVSKSTGETVTLEVGTYDYILNTTGGTNYSINSSMDTQTLTITQLTSILNGTINNTQGNFSTTNGTTSDENILLNATLENSCVGDGSIVLNGSIINIGILPLSNITNLSVGFYNVTFIYDGNVNCTADTEIFWINVTAEPDVILPNVIINSPINQTYVTNSILFNLTVLDERGVDNCLYSLNSGENNFTMENNSKEWFATNSSMSQGSHTANFYCNDTSNNINNTEIVTFFIDSISPNFNVIRNNINLNENINLTVNVTDDIGVGTVLAYLTYPNSTEINVTLSSLLGYYVNRSFALDLAGEYIVNYTSNDTSGNFNSTNDWFEVYDMYWWNMTLLDYNSNSVINANISFYRPNTTTLFTSNVTDSDGKANFYINKRFFDVNGKLSLDEFTILGIDFSNSTFVQSNLSLNFHRIDGEVLTETIATYDSFIGLAFNSTGFENNLVTILFNYSGYNYDVPGALRIIKCADWNYSDRGCSGSWSLLSDYSRNVDTKIITGNSTGFSSYFLAEDKCGNGICEVNYGETTSICSNDCKTTTVTVSGGGGGGGSSRISSKDLQKIEDLVKSYLNVGGVKIETISIYKELFAGDTTTFRVSLSNSLNSKNVISLSAKGDIASFLSFESTSIDLEPNEVRTILIRITVPKLIDSGSYDGDLILISGENEASIPITIMVLSPEGKLLDVKIQPLTPVIAPGEVLKFQTDLLNLGKTKKVDVQFDIQLIDVETGEILIREEEAFAVETSMSLVKNLTISENIPTGKYMLKGIAYYSNKELDGKMQASSIAYVTIQYSFFNRMLFGIYLWMYFILIFGIILIILTYYVFRMVQYSKKRFKIKLELNKLPHVGLNSGFVGKIAETGIRAFIDLDKLQMHTLVAGSTGTGKTVAAQDIVEEALSHNRGVIIFDPTAQWTGFLRKCDNVGMLNRYKYFGMKKEQAKAFNGNIKTIRDPYEVIDIEKYINRKGEITIFNISSLTPKEMDIVVSSTIEQIFKFKPEESLELKTLIVYDEVHRLLPKFGGSGQGFVQLERGAREFRKWGIGLVLISQVLSDFVGEIKANIGTEIQMGTRYEGDLERVNMKYGEDVLKAIAKSQIGTGMVVNPEYNNGRPYFVSFRPLFHSAKRLSNEELKKYEVYFNKIEDFDYQSAQLEKLGVDILDLKLELKLSKSKIKSGQFQMADMYLETIALKIIENWKRLGKSPVPLVKKRLSKSEVIEGIKKAKESRVRYIKENPQENISVSENISNLNKKIEGMKKEGINTSLIQIKLKDIGRRVKPFNGKIPIADAKNIKIELEEIDKSLDLLRDEKNKNKVEKT